MKLKDKAHKFMKKIIVIGCPGSGKSTFSRALHDLTGIPLFHLDMMYWNEDRTRVEKDVFYARLSNVLQKDEWIIDGDYSSTMEWRMGASDTIIFLDYPLEVCLQGASARVGSVRSDMPWVEKESKVDDEFSARIRNYNEEKRPCVLALLEKYSQKNIIILNSREQATEFLKNNL